VAQVVDGKYIMRLRTELFSLITSYSVRRRIIYFPSTTCATSPLPLPDVCLTTDVALWYVFWVGVGAYFS
jgi:hypothetical protein